MIILPNDPDSEHYVEQHFFTPLKRAHRVFEVSADSFRDAQESISSLFKEEKIGPEELFTLGLDFGNKAAHVCMALYDWRKSYGGAKPIYTVPAIEIPDFTNTTFKQDEISGIPYWFNYEPFISHTYESVVLYYKYMYGDYLSRKKLIEEFGDYKMASRSEYYKDKVNNVRSVIKGDCVFEIQPYFDFLSNNFKLNGIRMADTSQKDIPDCVLFFSVLHRPNTGHIDVVKEMNPKYVVYEDWDVEFHIGATEKPWNNKIEEFSREGYYYSKHSQIPGRLETFMDKKNIARYGSMAVLLEKA